MTADTLGAPDRLDLSGADPYPNDMGMITDPAKLPADRSAIPDDTLIVPTVWAALQGVKPATVYSNKKNSDKRRGTPEAKPGDMPPTDDPFTVGQTPVWTMGTYRAWEKSRPGKGAGAGRPAGSGSGERPRVRLPIECPHCHHEITAADMGMDGRASDGQAAAKPAAARRPGGPKRPRTAGKAR